MPADDLVDGTSHLNINGNDTSSPSNAVEIRPQHETQELQRRQRFLSARTMRDVTADFVAATEQLPPGELIKDEYFTLFEAVGALEIMDPKMDSGCVPPGDSFEPEFDVTADLSPSQVLWIMDEIFRLEMSFHDGYPLSQNLYTSLHIFDLIAPDNKDLALLGNFDRLLATKEDTPDSELFRTVLGAYCVSVVKCAQPMLGTITSQMYWEEEDFVTHLFGRELLPGISHHDARKLLVEAMDWLDDSDIEPELKYAIKYRLVCREYLLFSMDKSHECWEKLESKLDARTKDGTPILSSHRELSTPVPEAFSNKVTRQLATSTPPRPMPQLSWEEAREKWVQMCKDILAAHRLTSSPIREIPHALQRATWAFAYRKPEPNTFARAKMQDILCADGSVAGDVPHWELMLADLRELHLAGDALGDPDSFQIELPSDPRHKAARLIEAFMERNFHDYLDIYRFVCQNRCRLRRCLSQSAGVWNRIEADAMQVDSAVRGIIKNDRSTSNGQGGTHQYSPLKAWANNNTLRTIAFVIRLGFETELYLPREISLVYAALFHLESTLQQNMEYAQIFNFDKLEAAKKKGHQNHVNECNAAGTWIQILHVQHILHFRLSLALVNIFGLLERLHIIDTGLKRYGESQLQFETRMKPFLRGISEKIGWMSEETLRPTVAAQMNIEGKIFWMNISGHLKHCREMLAVLKKTDAADGKFVGTEEEWMDEIKKLERTCISLGVETSKLKAICEKHSALDVKDMDLSHVVEADIPFPSQRYHAWWVVPQIREKKI